MVVTDENSPFGEQHADTTITIARQSGQVIASTKVHAMPRPQIGNAAAILPRQVTVAAGAAYYADPQGRIHRFTAAAADTVVARFPLTNSQQELSFAVSPDGSLLMATVMSTPPLHSPPPAQLGDPIFAENQPWTVETFLSPAGGTAQSIAKRQSLGGISVTRLVGWDAQGPIAVLDAYVGAQDYPPSLTYSGPQAVHLALDGAHLDQLGGSACAGHLIDASAGGVVCYDSDTSAFSVRTPTGSLVWAQSLPQEPVRYWFNPALSPDGRRIAVQDRVFNQNGSTLSLPAKAHAAEDQLRGWIHSDLLATTNTQGRLVLVNMTDPEHPVVTDLMGHFIGLI